MQVNKAQIKTKKKNLMRVRRITKQQEKNAKNK